MRTFPFVFIFMVISAVHAQSEYHTDYKIQYELTYHLDSTNLDSSSKETLYLFSGSGQSVYMNHNIAHEEDIEERMRMQQQIQGYGDWNEAGGRNTNFDKIYYKNLVDASVLTVAEIMDKNYGYQEPNIPLVWVVGEEIQSFSGYTVQSATTSFAGRDYVAWFTTEVPILDGPYLFSGLPGLIVELYDTEQHYHFKMLSIEKLEETKIWTVPKYKTVTRSESRELEKKGKLAEVNEFLRGVREGWAMMTDNAGNVMSESEIRRNLLKQKESENNPIELE